MLICGLARAIGKLSISWPNSRKCQSFTLGSLLILLLLLSLTFASLNFASSLDLTHPRKHLRVIPSFCHSKRLTISKRPTQSMLRFCILWHNAEVLCRICVVSLQPLDSHKVDNRQATTKNGRLLALHDSFCDATLWLILRFQIFSKPETGNNPARRRKQAKRVVCVCVFRGARVHYRSTQCRKYLLWEIPIAQECACVLVI